MRDRILKAAMGLFAKGGVSNVTMRRIASRIEYSPGAIYRYFNNKNELLLALCQRGFEMLLEDMPVPGETEDVYSRLVNACRAYVRFALSHPDYYELMFSTEEISIPDVPDAGGASMRAYLNVLEMVRQCMKQGMLHGESPDAVAVSLWSSMHGLSSLLVKHQFNFIAEEEREKVVVGAFDFILRRHVHGVARGMAGSVIKKGIHQGKE